MNRWTMAIAMMVAVCVSAVAADPILPTYAGTNQPGAATAWFNSTTARVFENSSIRLTNMLVRTSAGATQDLTGLTILCRVGSTVNTVLYTGTVHTVQGSNGLWTCDVSTGTNELGEQVTLQTTVVGDTQSVIENWLKWYTQEPLD